MADASFFYGKEAEQYSFYRLPKALIKEEQYQKVSMSAKLLYGILLDRMNLSIKNKWLDKEGRVFLIYTLDEMMEDFNCSDKTAAKLLKELEQVDLIVRKRQGLGKPSLVYVKKVMTVKDNTAEQDQRTENVRNATSHTEKVRIQNRKKYESGIVKSTTLDSEDLRGNKTEYNNTNDSKTEMVCSSADAEERKEEGEVRHSQQNETQADSLKGQLKEQLEKQLDVEALQEAFPFAQDKLRTILAILLDTLQSHKRYIRIGGDEKPAEEVKAQLKQLNYLHIEYVLESLAKDTSRVRNMFGYILTVLYNAPIVMNLYYERLLHHNQANYRR